MWRMHLHTVLQLVCMAIVYVTKLFQQSSLAFPLALTLTSLFRHLSLTRIFSDHELDAVCLLKKTQ